MFWIDPTDWAAMSTARKMGSPFVLVAGLIFSLVLLVILAALKPFGYQLDC